MKKKLLYIDHYFHKKTASNNFLSNLLKEKYDVEIFYFDIERESYNAFNLLFSKEYDVVVIFQSMISIKKLKEFISFKKIVFFPMLDGIPLLTNPIWKEYQYLNIISFSKTLYNQLKEKGFSVNYIQYFPEVDYQNVDFGDEKVLYFWQRKNYININVVDKLFEKIKINKLILHKALDPGQKFVKPSKKWKNRITYSSWYNEKADVIKDIQKAAFYINPRMSEGIGQSFLEAMALGKCVISTDTPTMNEYIENGKTGYLYNIKDLKPLQIDDVRDIQKNTLDYMKNGYENWQKNKYKIFDWIDAIPNPDINLMEKNKYQEIKQFSLFCCIPMLKMVTTKDKIKYFLFNIFLVMKINYRPNKRKYYLFGILPLVRIKEVYKNE